jgi:hypothetical protein
MQEPDIPPLFQTIPKAESPLSFFGNEAPTGAISDKLFSAPLPQMSNVALYRIYLR